MEPATLRKFCGRSLRSTLPQNLLRYAGRVIAALCNEIMFTSSEINHNKENIKKWLSEDKHFAVVYSLHTNDESWASAYFVELKQRYPNSDIEKFITLWKWQQIIMAKEGDYHLGKETLDKNDLLDQFKYVLNNFDTRELTKSDKERIDEIFSNIVPIIRNKSGNYESSSTREAGVYKNGKKEEFKKLEIIKSQLNKCTRGIVIDDEWNEYTVIFPSNSNMYLFHWSTGA